jgi:2-iminoacetate synthase ThiH
MPKRPRLIRGKDYTVEDGQFVFTREYLLSLGTCCKNECKHCPYRSGDNIPAIVIADEQRQPRGSVEA